MNSRNHHRSGTVLVCVLACCLTAISLGAGAIQLSLRSARESKHTLRLRQTQWLLQAGVQRARQQLADLDYTGEVWSLPLVDSLGSEPRIVIVVSPSVAFRSAKPASVPFVAFRSAKLASLHSVAVCSPKPEALPSLTDDKTTLQTGTQPDDSAVDLQVMVTAEYGGRAGGEPTIRRSHSFLVRRPQPSID